MLDNDGLQRTYYIIASSAAAATVLGLASGGVSVLLRRHKESIRALHARIDKLETEAVTVKAFEKAIEDVLERSEYLFSSLLDRIDARFKRADERHDDLKDDLRELKDGQTRMETKLGGLPCPPTGGK